MTKPDKTIHIPLELHKQLKIKAAMEDVNLRDLVIEILEDSLKED